ncbi:hypothetical protein MASR1M8_07640 [Thermomonas brevis]
MSRRHVPAALLAAAILAALPVASAFAQQSPPERDQEPRSQQRASLSEAVRRVERNTRGEVLSAERVQYDGRDMHRVKVVDDQGRVRVFMQEPERRDDRARRGPPDDPRNRPRRPTRDDDN